MRFLFLFIFGLCLASCSSTKTWNVKDQTEMPFAYKARLSVKDYRVVGRVRGVYHQYCFLFNSFCINGTHPYDDLLNQAQEIGGDSVINFVLERGTFSILLDLYSSQTTVANGLALKILETKTSSLEVYGE